MHYFLESLKPFSRTLCWHIIFFCLMRWVTEILLRKFILEKPENLLENLLEKSWNFEFIFCWPLCNFYKFHITCYIFPESTCFQLMKKIYQKSNCQVFIDAWKQPNKTRWSAVHSIPELFLWLIFCSWEWFLHRLK